MNRFNLALTAVLALQLTVAGGVYLASQPVATRADSWALLDAPIEAIERIEITDEDGNRSLLARTDGEWRLAEYFDLPVDRDQLDKVLQSLAVDQPAWPVATSAAGRARFKVAEDDFNKEIVITAGDSTHRLYLGTSPSYRQLHVRRDNDDAVYGIKLDGYAIAAKSEQWLEKKLLRPADQISEIHGTGFSLRKVDGEWQSLDEPGEPLTDAIDNLAQAFADLRVNAAAAADPVGQVTRLRILAGGTRHEYEFFSDDEKYYVRRDDREPAFRINKTAWEKLANASAGQLLQSPDENHS